MNLKRKKHILCLSESAENVLNFVKDAHFHFFQMEPLEPDEHCFSTFKEIYNALDSQIDLAKIDLIIAENIEAIPLVYFIRKHLSTGQKILNAK